jgi:hypothetical protein
MPSPNPRPMYRTPLTRHSIEDMRLPMYERTRHEDSVRQHPNGFQNTVSARICDQPLLCDDCATSRKSPAFVLDAATLRDIRGDIHFFELLFGFLRGFEVFLRRRNRLVAKHCQSAASIDLLSHATYHGSTP